MKYIVLGMHKSGTTLVSKMLHESGINMGLFDEKLSYDKGNQYERHETLSINMQILACGDNLSIDVTKTADKQKILSDNRICRQIKKLIDKLNNEYNFWGFKDPRTCLTFPIWDTFLGQYKIIFIYRDPIEMYLHYTKKVSPFRLIRKMINSWKSITAWYIYNNEARGIVVNSKNESFIIQYSNLMDDDHELSRLEKFVGVHLVDCRKESLYRSKRRKKILYALCAFAQRIFLNRDIEGLYAQLQSLENRKKIGVDISEL